MASVPINLPAPEISVPRTPTAVLTSVGSWGRPDQKPSSAKPPAAEELAGQRRAVAAASRAKICYPTGLARVVVVGMLELLAAAMPSAVLAPALLFPVATEYALPRLADRARRILTVRPV